MAIIVPFKFETADIRVIDNDGEPWFVLADVCAALDLQNPSQTASGLDENERSMFNIGRQGSVIIVNESGLWAVALTSRKPEARNFRKWLTSEVIPEIRKTGSYSGRPLSAAEQLLASVQLSVDLERRTAALEAQQVKTTAIAQEAISLVKFQQEQFLVDGPNTVHMYTMAHYCEHRGAKWPLDILKMLGKRASNLCRDRGILTGKVEHERWAKGVNTYPVSILKDVFHEYVSELETYVN